LAGKLGNWIAGQPQEDLAFQHPGLKPAKPIRRRRVNYH